MGLFKNNYDTPGKGVLKTPHEKKGFFKFWELFGGHFGKLIKLNLMYFVFCIPLFALVMSVMGFFGGFKKIYLLLAIPSVIIGPATAALMKVARNFAQERPCFVFHTFNDAMKKNFRQGIIMGIIDVVFVLGFLIGVPMYANWAKANTIMYVPYAICLICMLMFLMMHFYIYLMICSTTLNLKQILKNSFFLVSLGLKESLWTLLAVAFIVVGIVLFIPYTLIVIPLLPMSMIAFIESFNCFPVIRKHVIQPYYDSRGEENPEFDYKKVSEDEALFKDKAEYERDHPASAPSPEKRYSDSNHSRRGKTIS